MVRIVIPSLTMNSRWAIRRINIIELLASVERNIIEAQLVNLFFYYINTLGVISKLDC